VGFQSKVGANARVLSESRLWPLVEIGSNSIVGGDVMLPAALVARAIDGD
jgi:serine acetyltransferase